jgi:hypothetical protein
MKVKTDKDRPNSIKQINKARKSSNKSYLLRRREFEAKCDSTVNPDKR